MGVGRWELITINMYANVRLMGLASIIPRKRELLLPAESPSP